MLQKTNRFVLGNGFGSCAMTSAEIHIYIYIYIYIYAYVLKKKNISTYYIYIYIYVHIKLFKRACKQNCGRAKFKGSSKGLPYV